MNTATLCSTGDDRLASWGRVGLLSVIKGINTGVELGDDSLRPQMIQLQPWNLPERTWTMPADEKPTGEADGDMDHIVNRIPNPGPGGRRRRKPAFTVLPPGTSAEEAAKLLKEFADKHADGHDAPADDDNA